MKLASAAMAVVLILCFAAPVSAGANVTLDIGASDLYASVPLCTYWYSLDEKQGISPHMTITNLGFSPITVTGVSFSSSTAVISGVPCEIAQSMHRSFVLTECPQKTAARNHAGKQAVVFTISKTGG